MKAVIMAGGYGTRVQSVTSDIPKPMFLIADKPILQYQIESLIDFDIKEIIIVIGPLGAKIRNYFGNGSKWGISITYVEENTPLGTAGALFFLKKICKEDFLLLFGDLMLDIDWKRFIEFHKEKGGLVTLFAHPNAHPFDSDLLDITPEGKVFNLYKKNQSRPQFYHNLVNAGVYAIRSDLLQSFIECSKLDFEKDIVCPYIKEGQVFAYKSTEYIKDMGTPERYKIVIKDVLNGIVSKKRLTNRQKCIFLDRDGTINKLNGYIKNLSQLELLPEVAQAIRMINKTEFLTIVVTNQPVIARGECCLEELEQIHKKMEVLLGEAGAYIDDLFFCPHHPDRGFENEKIEYKIACKCRKPQIGLLTQASEKYNIDLSKSWIIGDTTVDIQTGINAGLHTILLDTGEGGKDRKYNAVPDYRSKTLIEAVDIIMRRHYEKGF